MNLRQARCIFAQCLAELILYANNKGFQIAFAEGMDRVTAKDPTTDHMKGSLHEIGLAQDIDLYANGIYLDKTEHHAFLGNQWKQIGNKYGVTLAWGGDFNKPDGNHYSLTWEGKN